MINLNEYKVQKIITKPNLKFKFNILDSTTILKLNIGDIILTKNKAEPPIVVKNIANTLDCYSIKEYGANCGWYRFPYLVQPKDAKFVYKLKLLQELVLNNYLLDDEVYTGDSFMYFEQSATNLYFNTYTKTEIKGVYVKTQVVDNTQTKRLMVLSNHRFERLKKYNTLRFNEYITPDACDVEWLNEIKEFIKPLLK